MEEELENLKSENADLRTELENSKSENVDLRTENADLRTELENLKEKLKWKEDLLVQPFFGHENVFK
jgi:regulator of replication initiation timing